MTMYLGCLHVLYYLGIYSFDNSMCRISGEDAVDLRFDAVQMQASGGLRRDIKYPPCSCGRRRLKGLYKA
jgi:hypothetical protein